METFPKPNNEIEDQAYHKTIIKYEEIVSTLPKGKGWNTKYLVQYQGYWLTPDFSLKSIMLIQHHFKPQPTHILMASFPKSGTNWFKALIFATVNRNLYDFSNHPLLNTAPIDCFPFLDDYIHQSESISDTKTQDPSFLFSTHFSYALLSQSVKASGCRIVYVCREPKDVLVSMWIFSNKLRPKEQPPLSLQEAFELFCEGISSYGPCWDHVLGYWRASLESPNKIFFLKYEEMKREPSVHIKRLADFVGQPFSPEEESEKVVEKIIKLCSFDNLSNMEVNKHGTVLRLNKRLLVDNSNFFRKGEVGDWKNHLTSEMIERLDQITKQKFHGTGLTFDMI